MDQVQNDSFPRPLTDSERSTLDFLLSADFEGVAELRQQAEGVVAVARCPCGCATVNLEVPDDLPRASVRSPFPVAAYSKDQGVTGTGLILFVDDGALSSLEIYGYGPETPDIFPAMSDYLAPVATTDKAPPGFVTLVESASPRWWVESASPRWWKRWALMIAGGYLVASGLGGAWQIIWIARRPAEYPPLGLWWIIPLVVLAVILVSYGVVLFRRGGAMTKRSDSN